MMAPEAEDVTMTGQDEAVEAVVVADDALAPTDHVATWQLAMATHLATFNEYDGNMPVENPDVTVPPINTFMELAPIAKLLADEGGPRTGGTFKKWKASVTAGMVTVFDRAEGQSDVTYYHSLRLLLNPNGENCIQKINRFGFEMVHITLNGETKNGIGNAQVYHDYFFAKDGKVFLSFHGNKYRYQRGDYENVMLLDNRKPVYLYTRKFTGTPFQYKGVLLTLMSRVDTLEPNEKLPTCSVLFLVKGMTAADIPWLQDAVEND